ncbi:hypothetical protein AB835_00020 [Candidatus Endobugula sertula]|uniref:Uncharacterized protein n=1 Tax=Candidatus Endobugula sertula TaxID=62101 RepID=A0A1D2QU75_9GAMM|nr:hypothetical protein AB835_00020 [Candidatus Endobugula sertula]
MTQKRLSHSHEWQTKHEDLLIAIDQLEQLTEVMGEALIRVKQRFVMLENTLDIVQSTTTETPKTKDSLTLAKSQPKHMLH